MDGSFEIFHTWLPVLPGHWKGDSIWRNAHGPSVEAGSGVTHVTSAHIPLERMLLFHLTEREAGICMVGGEKLLIIS